MLRIFIFLFGAITCASGRIILTEKKTFEEADSKEIFALATRSIIRAAQPFYYVSNDLYENTCTDERCNDVADLFLKGVKSSVDPCDDFYTFACGRKQSKMQSLTKEIQEILEQQLATEEETKSLALEKKFYRSCMEQQELDYKTKKEFTRLLELSNGLALFRSDIPLGISNWQQSDNFYASFGFEHAFFNVYVTRDPSDTNDVNLISLMPPTPLYVYSLHSLLKHGNLSDFVSYLLDEHKEDGKLSVIDFDDVMVFNKALHEILPSFYEENMTILSKNKMTIKDWQDIYDENQVLKVEENKNHIHWSSVIDNLSRKANIDLDESETIVITKIDYFAKLAQLLEKTSSVTVEKYVYLKFLTQIGKYLSPSLASNFINVKDRPTFCIEQSDNQLIGTTYEYIKRHVPHEQKIYAEVIIDNIRSALINLLSNANWMDKETKSYATNKLKNLDITVGYPHWQTNRTFVNHYYGNLHLHSNFFENVIKYKRKAMIHEFRGLRNSHSFDPATMFRNRMPLIYHFEISSHTNHILFPTEYLNEKKYKLFNLKLPSAVNYGSFASMIGSILYDYVSLTDDLRFDEYHTRTNEGLSKDTIEAYKIKEKCLANQLVNYKKSRFDHLASILDRDTIQIDKLYEKMVGLRTAFEAYKSIVNKNDEHLPGFENMSGNQLFFLSYAERICEIGDIYDKYDTYETSLRVNGVVSNLQEFADSFQCSRHSAMNREIKCELFS